MAIKKGDYVRLVREKFEGSVEAQASDTRLSPYLFEGKGKVLELRGDHAQVQFPVPTPNVWLKAEQLEAV